ncbi:hypothetical protein [Methylocystis parvus]|uniref:Uncharacterized protein n=1 Tax=Methylocystis parvus TaxID=134 RepID=A0A6B8M763_9HYPH|nr:hypothetical protein [Methylocystis parvus]QGM98338.1 hypothetical protein F7D14_13190 [Methylocystis parvus]WBK01334.1 hypothetical protein MMG94_06385 [Methylocystis parvus OBBP]
MLGFEIWKNGKKLSTAGLTEGGAISLMLTWVGKGAGASSRIADGVAIDGLDLRVGGIDASDPASEQSVEWIEDTALHLGDDIQIRLVSTNEIDAPIRREPTSVVSAAEAGLRFVACATCGAPRLQSSSARPAE